MSSLLTLEVQINEYYSRFLDYVVSKQWREDNDQKEYCLLLNTIKKLVNWLKEPETFPSLFHLTHHLQMLRNLLIRRVINIKSFSDLIVESFANANNLMVQNKLQHPPSKMVFKQSQISKFFSSNKDPIQFKNIWQLETNKAQLDGEFENMKDLYSSVDTLIENLQVQQNEDSFKEYSNNRLVELFLAEKSYLENQLKLDISQSCIRIAESLSPDHKQTDLLFQINSKTYQITQEYALNWFIKYNQTTNKFGKLLSECINFLKKIQQQREIFTQKLLQFQENSSFEANLSDNTQKKSKKKPQLGNNHNSTSFQVYKVAYDQNSQITNINDNNKQSSLLPYQLINHLSSNFDDRAQTIEVLNYKNSKVILDNDKNGDLEKSERLCIGCIIF